MESRTDESPATRAERWIGLVLCAAVFAAGLLGELARNRPGYGRVFAPDWIPLATAGLAAAGIMPSKDRSRLRRVRRALHWVGLLLMVWAANGLPLDVLRVIGLIPFPIDWPGLLTRTLALAAVVVIAHLALARPTGPAPTRPAGWYGYAAFVLALPYPILRTIWALGGTPGLSRPGEGGEGWAPLVLAIPWLMAAVLSLLLVPTWRWMPRRLLLLAGWTATAIVGMIGPAACWALISALLAPAPAAAPPPNTQAAGIATWVFALFYGSWLLWAIAGFAATRSYQLRSARDQRT